MPHNKVFQVLSIVLATLALVITACDERAQQSTTSPQADTRPAWMMDSIPEGAVGVAQAKASAKEGDQIILTGRIGGRAEPITTASGLFIIMDTSVPSCADMAEDNCETPWDYCCESPESITANAATIQLRDAEGKPVALNDGELQPLSRVTVTGTVAPRPNDDTLVVRAVGVRVATD